MKSEGRLRAYGHGILHNHGRFSSFTGAILPGMDVDDDPLKPRQPAIDRMK
jgi:hypothetical protein